MMSLPLPTLSCALRLSPFLALLACSGQPSNEIVALKPDIAVAPDVLDFGEVVVDYTDSQILSVINAGRVELEVSELSISDNTDGVFTITQAGAVTVEEEETLGIEIAFTPAALIDYARTLTILSDDPDAPAFAVPLVGKGGDGPIPDIEVDPAVVDFGEASGPETAWFILRNTGDGDLIVEGVTQTGSGNFMSPNLPQAGAVLAPGAETSVIMTYTPSGVGDSGTVRIETNDPDEPSIEIALLANGGSTDAYPEAVIDCPAFVDPPSTLPLDGRDSFDPAGNAIVSYEWALVEAPEGSQASIEQPAEPLTRMDVDLAGFWEVDLTVTNALGVRSAPARCEFLGVPQADIHVELVWDRDEADLDLHLAQAGTEFYDSPGDCSPCNTAPDWGAAGALDDPRYAIDNTDGFGPEEIKIDEPADGDYTVMVHYSGDHGGGSTMATVRIWVEGEEAGEYEMLLEHNELWNLGYIRWPMAVFVPVDEAVVAAPRRSCF